MSNKSKADKHKISEIDDRILKHFDIQRRLGKGAYGIVWKAVDKKSKTIAAVKKIFDAFRNETDAQRTFREIMFLRAFRSHPNVIKLHNVYKASNNLDIYLSFEFMESDLHNVIKKGTVLKDVHKRYIMYQLLNAVGYIHSGNVIHRDLKPSNILLNSKCWCKIADFGLARSVSNRPAGDSNTSIVNNEPLLTDYVATRWYRAPEILVASKRYTKGIDMWSLGCILGEMLRGKPMFPGSSTVNQIERIVTALSPIAVEDIAALGAGFGSNLLNQHPTNNTLTMDNLLENAPEEGKQLIKQLLVLDPAKRLTAKEALTNSFVHKFRNPTIELELKDDVLPPFRDDVQFTVPEYRSKLYEIVQQTLEKNHISVSIDSKQTAATLRNCTKPESKKVATAQVPSTNKKVKTISVAPKTSISRQKNTIPLSSQTRPSLPIAKTINISHQKIEIDNRRINKAESLSSSLALTAKDILSAKRHSIDCAYSLNQRLLKTNQKEVLKVSNAKKDTSLPTADRRLGFRSMVASSNNLKSQPAPTVVPSKFKISKSDILSMSNDGSNYYEKRLKLLEEKIQKHQKEIREFCCVGGGAGGESSNIRLNPASKRTQHPLPKYNFELNRDIYDRGDGNSKTKVVPTRSWLVPAAMNK